jgi:hypothetical protein
MAKLYPLDPRIAEIVHRIIAADELQPHARYDKLTVGDCEQLAETHTREAMKILEAACPNDIAEDAAAEAIFLANRYRYQYHKLVGRKAAEPDDYPFPHCTYVGWFDQPPHCKGE